QLSGGRPFSPAGDLFSPRSFGHTGFTGTSLWIDPDRELYAILLTNRVHPSRENQAHLRLRPLFHNGVAAAVLASKAALSQTEGTILPSGFQPRSPWSSPRGVAVPKPSPYPVARSSSRRLSSAASATAV